MSALSETQLSILVRRRLNLPETTVLRVLPLINDGLRRLAFKVAKSRILRHHLLTDPASTSAALDGNGAADLSSLVTSPRILKECLQYGRIYHSSNSYPLRWNNTSAQGALGGVQDNIFLHCWLEGDLLYTRSSDGNVTPLSGVLSFAVAYWPTLLQLPQALEELLVDELVKIMTERPEQFEEAA